MRPAMNEAEYAARLANATRKDLLRLCRRIGYTACGLKTNEGLIHFLWIKVGRLRAEEWKEES